ncbi:signal recognition particle receptor beta subunit-domain-containing protein [Gaertneriomyces semiglobifer]|nr:signal recognition particle receptor beta subunit-domain-containing protein [Gaertneriomyces semiglobifer]
MPLAGLLPPFLLTYDFDGERSRLAVAVILLALTVFGLIYLWRQQRRPKRNTYLLAGLSGSGKTVLYLQLRYGQVVETHTSLQENTASIPRSPSQKRKSKPRAAHIVDLPGHEKLRFKYAEYIASAAGVVFIVDSTTIARQVRQAAEYLYDILANRYTQRNEIPLLILCNKCDVLLALKEDRIKALLEEEIDRLRVTRTAEVQNQDEDKEEEFLGDEGKPFKFEQLPNGVRFKSCSLKSKQSEEDGLASVQAFIAGRL